MLLCLKAEEILLLAIASYDEVYSFKLFKIVKSSKLFLES